METPTIKSIKGLLPTIDKNIISFRQYFKDQKTDLDAALYGVCSLSPILRYIHIPC